MNLRKLNVFLVVGILVMLIAHAVTGSLRLAGADTANAYFFADATLLLVTLHVIVTSILTVQTLKARKLSGAGYFKDNGIFWVRRISGFVVLIPLVMHFTIFAPSHADAIRLEVFTTGRLISQILLVAAIALHVLTNIRPLMISLGAKKTKAFVIDALVVISVMMLLFAIAFVIYYVRWMSL